MTPMQWVSPPGYREGTGKRCLSAVHLRDGRKGRLAPTGSHTLFFAGQLERQCS